MPKPAQRAEKPLIIADSVMLGIRNEKNGRLRVTYAQRGEGFQHGLR